MDFPWHKPSSYWVFTWNFSVEKIWRLLNFPLPTTLRGLKVFRREELAFRLGPDPEFFAWRIYETSWSPTGDHVSNAESQAREAWKGSDSSWDLGLSQAMPLQFMTFRQETCGKHWKTV